MTDLTEQFLDDEIDESKLYYFKQKMSEEIEVGSPFALNMVRAIDGIYLDYFLIDKVLAPVPSYEEWKAKLEENAQLKELLKAAYSWFPEVKDMRRKMNLEVLKQRIIQVLGEDK